MSVSAYLACFPVLLHEAEKRQAGDAIWLKPARLSMSLSSSTNVYGDVGRVR